MNSYTHAHSEVAFAVAQAVARAHTLPLAAATPADLEDHRTAALGDMAEALNRIEAGTGDRWMQALYPELDLSEPL